MRVRLERLVNGQALRTNTVEGEAVAALKQGHRFALVIEPLDPALDFRLVRTSVVQRVRTIDESVVYDFDTENSTYRLTLLGPS